MPEDKEPVALPPSIESEISLATRKILVTFGLKAPTSFDNINNLITSVVRKAIAVAPPGNVSVPADYLSKLTALTKAELDRYDKHIVNDEEFTNLDELGHATDMEDLRKLLDERQKYLQSRPLESMTYAQWVERYRPKKNTVVDSAPDGDTMFETDGAEYAHVTSQDVHTVWTQVQVPGGFIISPGNNRVNRQGYYVTEVPWEHLNIEVSY